MVFNLNKEQVYFFLSAISSRLINAWPTKKPVHSILVIKWDEIGDMVYALPVFESLKKEYPEAYISVMCKEFVKPLVQNNPFIQSIIHQIPNGKRFDLIVELRGNYNTLRYALCHRPNRRIDRGTVRIKNKFRGRKCHELSTNFEILKPILNTVKTQIPIKLYIDEVSAKVADDFILKNQLNNFAVIHCGGRKKLRQWSAANFASLARILHTTYNLTLVFAGTEEDEPDINQIISMSHCQAIVCTKNFSLLNFASLVSHAKLFIGNESGPLHIAAAMKTPVIGIYGPGVKDIFYPLGETSKVVHHILECNPCDQVNCIRPSNPCINLVTVAEVESKVKELLV